MKNIIIMASALLLGGCVTSATLIAQDGPRYHMNVDPVAKRVSTEIDGVQYSGKFVKNDSIGFGTSQSFGAYQSTGMGTMVVQGSNGQAVMTSTNGGYIECTFNANGMTVIGKCQSNTGRQFVLTTD